MQVHVFFVLTCLSAQTKLFGMETVFMFKMWYRWRVQASKVRQGNTAHELCRQGRDTATNRMQNAKL